MFDHLRHPCLVAFALPEAEVAGIDISSLCMTPMLPHLLRREGYQNTQFRAYAMEFSCHTEGWSDIYHGMEVVFYLIRPLLVRTRVASQEEIERLYEQALIEMHANDFLGMWHFFSCWGMKP